MRYFNLIIETAQALIEAVLADERWIRKRLELEQEARKDAVGLRKRVTAEVERHFHDGPLYDNWELGGHDIEKAIEGIWEMDLSYWVISPKIIYMLMLKWVEEHCPLEEEVVVRGKNQQEVDILKHVSVLEPVFKGTRREHTALWRKIIKEGKSIKKKCRGGKELALFDAVYNKGRTYDMRTVNSVIGEMSDKYNVGIPEIAKLLRDSDSRTYANYLNRSLEELDFATCDLENLRKIIR